MYHKSIQFTYYNSVLLVCLPITDSHSYVKNNSYIHYSIITKFSSTFHLPQQYEVRLKTIAYTLLGGRKTQWHFNERWIGDELSMTQYNSKASQYIKQVNYKGDTLINIPNTPLTFLTRLSILIC